MTDIELISETDSTSLSLCSRADGRGLGAALTTHAAGTAAELLLGTLTRSDAGPERSILLAGSEVS